NARRTVQRLGLQPRFQREQFAFGAAAGEPAAFERGDASGIVTAIFEPFEGFKQPGSGQLLTENADDTAHDVFRLYTLKLTHVIIVLLPLTQPSPQRGEGFGIAPAATAFLLPDGEKDRMRGTNTWLNTSASHMDLSHGITYPGRGSNSNRVTK